MNEEDLVKIKTALESPRLLEACENMEKVLKELGWEQTKKDK